MGFSFLVLHGPNLARRAREELDPRLESRAGELDVALTIVQSNGEAGLLDALHAHAEEVDAVVVNPGALAPSAFALAEGLEMVGLPTVEALLAPLPPERGPSALTNVAKAQLVGSDAYERALEALAPLVPTEKKEKKRRVEPSSAPVPRGKTIGRRAAPPPEPPAEASARGKTIGRGRPEERPVKEAPASAPSGMLTRAQVSERIQQRLKGQQSPEGLAQWARDAWTGLQRGAPVEAGAKDTIENVLLTLMAGAKASDAMLVAQMAKLDR